jgi:hypothetical protein
MVSESVFVAIVAGVFTVIGAGIGGAATYLSDRKNATEAERQLYHQHALQEKFTAYRDLYLAFDDVIAKFKQATVSGPGEVATYETELWEPYRDLRTKWDIASIYIDDEDEIAAVEEALDTINDANTWLKSMSEASDEDHIRSEMAWDYEVDSDELEEAYETVTAVLKPKLDPPNVGP